MPCPPQAAPAAYGAGDVFMLPASEIQTQRAFWNDLWSRSNISWATARAEQTALWLEHFGAGLSCQTLVVRENGQWLISLPLVKHSQRGPGIANLPTTPWLSFGPELMVDLAACRDHHWDLLVKHLRKLPWPVLWLEQVRVAEPRWHGFVAALQRHGWKAKLTASEHYGLTTCRGDWDAYEKSRQGRSSRQRGAKRLSKLGEGPVEFTLHHPITAEEATKLVTTALVVEHRSWKGKAGTSIIASGHSKFYEKMAVDLARHGELEIAFLQLGGIPIASMISCVSNRVCHNFKLGYDEAYGKGCPGQLIIQQHLQQAYAGAPYDTVDDVGPVQPYTSIWNTSSYEVGQLVAVSPKLAGTWHYLRERLRCLWRSKICKKAKKKG